MGESVVCQSKMRDMSSNKKDFTELSFPAQIGIAGLVAIEVAAKIAALVDISRRPATKIRGPKWAWASAQLLNGVGPIAYWSMGRK